MMIRWLLAAVHLLALGIGMGAIHARARALKVEPLDRAALSSVFTADNWWALAALLWLSTGIVRALGNYEKGTAYYLSNPLFHTKLTLFLIIFALEIGPMKAFIRWRRLVRKGEPVDTSKARTFARISVAQTHILVIIVLLAAALARGIGAR